MASVTNSVRRLSGLSWIHVRLKMASSAQAATVVKSSAAQPSRADVPVFARAESARRRLTARRMMSGNPTNSRFVLRSMPETSCRTYSANS